MNNQVNPLMLQKLRFCKDQILLWNKAEFHGNTDNKEKNIIYNKWYNKYLSASWCAYWNTLNWCHTSDFQCPNCYEKTRPELEEEAAQDKTTFLDAMNWLQATIKYMCPFDTENNSNVMCNNAKNKLYSLRFNTEINRWFNDQLMK